MTDIATVWDELESSPPEHRRATHSALIHLVNLACAIEENDTRLGAQKIGCLLAIRLGAPVAFKMIEAMPCEHLTSLRDCAICMPGPSQESDAAARQQILGELESMEPMNRWLMHKALFSTVDWFLNCDIDLQWGTPCAIRLGAPVVFEMIESMPCGHSVILRDCAICMPMLYS